MSDVYPRFTIEILDPITLRTTSRPAYRIGTEAADAFAESWVEGTPARFTRYEAPPRFRIKIDPFPSRRPFILADASRPAYRGRFLTLALALAEMDDKVREERGRERYSSRHVNTPCTVEPIFSEPSA